MLNDTRLPARFWAKVDAQPDGCWVWMASKSPLGYGYFQAGRGIGCRFAHRVAYTALVGPVPEGLELDHVCRNTRCVNPAHLEAVTHAENVRRGASGALKSRAVTHCPRGHAYDGGNLYIPPSGGRYCRACARARKLSKAYRESNRERERARRASQRG